MIQIDRTNEFCLATFPFVLSISKTIAAPIESKTISGALKPHLIAVKSAGKYRVARKTTGNIPVTNKARTAASGNIIVTRTATPRPIIKTVG